MEILIDVLKKAQAYLAAGGVERSKVDAEWIIADALGCQRLELFLKYDQPVLEDKLQLIRDRLKRRRKREPLQHILGGVPFCGIHLRVTSDALIPRPETEELLEWLIPEVMKVKAPRVVDLGTGTGAIALAIASAVADARVLAIDTSRESLALACENAEALGLRDRVKFKHGDWLSGFDRQADVIVSNPPYLTEEEWLVAEPEIRDYEPKMALVSNDEGMEDLKKIIQSSWNCLAENGILALEMGIHQGPALCTFAEKAGFKSARVRKDVHGRDRFMEIRK